MNDRYRQMTNWLDSLGYLDYTLSKASEDASFRSYLRVECGTESWVLMDAPPEKESCDRFIAVAGKLREARLSAPEIIHQDQSRGFLLLTDFGTSDYLSLLDANTEAPLYADALAALLKMQTRIECNDLPEYDEHLLLQEMDLFRDWFLAELLGIELNRARQLQWQSIKQALVQNALEQPQVFVHRDYHSRNLMKIEHRNPGILDFQDAVKGPVTYDLVSLLRDCYIDWPAVRVDQLALDYYELTKVNGLVEVKPAKFLCWFNLMGVQRHLKAIGIFSRLKIRDGKNGYLKDIPRTLEYILQISAEEMNMKGLYSLISELNLKFRLKALI
ncbi:MAG: phosphotransferase [Gammaproteobacteria bacterium]|nr:phosphotransferase [Gammaproteobacteria bacterium]